MKQYSFLIEAGYHDYNEEDMRNHETSAGVIKDNQGRYLIQDHVKHNMLTFPIGKIKPPETPLDGLKTEMWEELGIKVLQAKELFTYKKTYIFDGKPIKILTYVFDIIKYTGTPKNKEPKKHRWVKFMNLDDVVNSKRRIADCVTEYLIRYKK